METKKVMVVDDETEILDLVEIYLKNEGFEVYKFDRGEPALTFLEKNTVNLAILDIMLPDINGFDLCEKIREKYYFPILMLTAKTADADMVNGMMVGADDYIKKPFMALELIARVKAQLRRAETYNQGAAKEEHTYTINGLEINADTHVARLYEETLDLTPIEFNILLYLAQNQGRVVTSEELFEAVWKEKYFDSNNTVFVHIARIREKMHENSRKPIYIKTVWGVGYKL